jgi:ubiquinol-cytochrome c reductase cytochrome c1 subunit
MVTTGIVGATGLAYMVANNQVSANMADEGLHPPAYPWYHSSPLHTFDHAAYVTCLDLQPPNILNIGQN